MDGAAPAIVDRTMADVVRHWATRQPEAPVLVAEGRAPLGYGALAGRLAAIRKVLAGAGLGPGSRVALLHPGGADMAALILALMDGTVAAPLNPAVPAEEIAAQLHARRVDGVVIDPSMSRAVQDAVRDAARQGGLALFEVVVEESARAGMVGLRQIAAGTGAVRASDQAADVALIQASSGTTGTPKIAPIRHGQIMARSRVTARLLALTPADRGLNFNKLFLHGGFANMCAGLYAGGSMIMMPSFEVALFFRALSALRPSWTVGSFTINQAIHAEAVKRNAPVAAPALRLIRTTSGAFDGAMADPVIEAYSSTETGRVAGNPLPPGLRKRGTVGPPADCEVAILDETGQPVPAGATGEVVVRGAGVFDGYENDPAANEQAFYGDWYRTGDRGSFDADGYLALSGRIKETINRGGEKISPAEIDDALLAHPDVADAAVFAIPHPSLGELVGAAIVPAAGKDMDRAGLTRFLRERLTRIKIPVAFLCVGEIPRGPSGKILRTELADRFAAQSAAAR
jgi:acyl-CoA synthetase (AMP-forming)/AMP-acid ligase II